MLDNDSGNDGPTNHSHCGMMCGTVGMMVPYCCTCTQNKMQSSTLQYFYTVGGDEEYIYMNRVTINKLHGEPEKANKGRHQMLLSFKCI